MLKEGEYESHEEEEKTSCQLRKLSRNLSPGRAGATPAGFLSPPRRPPPQAGERLGRERAPRELQELHPRNGFDVKCQQVNCYWLLNKQQ